MFPDSRIAANYSLNHTNASYITGEGLAPYFLQMIINSIVKPEIPFSVQFETTTTQVKKQMDLTLGYLSSKHEDVWTLFYTSLVFGHAEGDKISTEMYNMLLNDKTPLESMATLIWDYPNVTKRASQNMSKLTSQDHAKFPGLIDLGSCTIHTVHNAFGKRIE